MLLLFFIVVFAVGLLLGAYAVFGRKKVPVALADTLPVAPPDPRPNESATWTHEAGAEFAGLSESARCDLIFAVGAFDDERSRRLLTHALDDPSTTVALAAAHALSRNGRVDDVREYAKSHQGQRSDELLQLLSLLA